MKNKVSHSCALKTIPLLQGKIFSVILRCYQEACTRIELANFPWRVLILLKSLIHAPELSANRGDEQVQPAAVRILLGFARCLDTPQKCVGKLHVGSLHLDGILPFWRNGYTVNLENPCAVRHYTLTVSASLTSHLPS